MTPRAVERARADVVRLAQAEHDLSRRRAAKLAEIAAPDGDELLAGELAGEEGALGIAAEKAAKVAAEAAALASAIAAARRAREAAIPHVWAAEAELKRAEAAKLRAEAEVLQERAAGPLAKLREIMGVDYVPGPRPEFLAGDTATVRALMYGYDAAPTKADDLLARAEALEAEAAKLEAQAVSRAGSASGANADEVFAAVLSDPYRLGPTLAEVAAWARDAEAAAREPWRRDRLSRHLPVDDAAWRAARPVYALTWTAAGIAAGSRVTVPAAPNGRPPDANDPHGWTPSEVPVPVVNAGVPRR